MTVVVEDMAVIVDLLLSIVCLWSAGFAYAHSVISGNFMAATLFLCFSARYVKVWNEITLPTVVLAAMTLGFLFKVAAERKMRFGSFEKWVTGLALCFLVSLCSAFLSGRPVLFGRINTFLTNAVTVVLIRNIRKRNGLQALVPIYLTPLLIIAASILASHIRLVPLILLFSHREGIQRFGGLFGDPNFAALAVSTSIPWIYAATWGKQFRQVMIRLIALFGVYRAIRLTGSLTGLVCFAALVLISEWAYGKRAFSHACVLLACAIALIVVWVAPVGPASFATELIDVRRKSVWTNAWNAFASAPICGIGPGNLTSQGGTRAHNLLLEALAELGIMGCICLLGVVYTSAKTCWAAIRECVGNERRVAASILISLIGWLIGGISLTINYEDLFWGILSFGPVAAELANKSGGGDDKCIGCAYCRTSRSQH